MGQQNNLTIPTNEERILAAVERAKRHVARQALLSAGTTFVPIPGVDMLLDVTVLIKMMEQINQEFGLTPSQIDQLPTAQKVMVYEAINWVGVLLAGKVISAPLATTVLKSVGVKMSSKQAARWVPLVGQATAAALGYGALRNDMDHSSLPKWGRISLNNNFKEDPCHEQKAYRKRI